MQLSARLRKSRHQHPITGRYATNGAADKFTYRDNDMSRIKTNATAHPAAHGGSCDAVRTFPTVSGAPRIPARDRFCFR